MMSALSYQSVKCMVSLRGGYYKSIGTHRCFIVNASVVICGQISDAIILNVTCLNVQAAALVFYGHL